MATAANPNEEIVGDYRVIEDKAHKLGSGSGGTVYLAEHVTVKKKFAAAKKTSIYKEFLESGEFETEADLLMHKIPPHENIIKVYDFIKKEYEEKGVEMIDLWLLMEYGRLGNLKEFAQQNHLTIQQKVELMFQSSLGVKHLHDRKPEPVSHRDIKPENIVIMGSVDNPIARICDFGAARSVLQRSGRFVTMTSLTGTESYAAPEQTQLKAGKFSYDKSVDDFSLGVTFLPLLECSKGKRMTPKTMDGKSIGQAMWELSTRWDITTFSLRIDDPSDSPLEKSLKDIIKHMIQLRPGDRLSISEVVQRLSVLRASTSTVERLSELRMTTPKLIAVQGRSVWVREGSAWEELPDMPDEQPDWWVCYCIFSDGIVAVGGLKDGTMDHSSMCHHFSLLTLCWTRLADMSTARDRASAVALGDILLVLGGGDKHDKPLAVCERFHTGAGVWSPAAPMMEPLAAPLVAAAAGKVFVLPRDYNISPGTQLQQYDPDVNKFSHASSPPQHVQNTMGACLVGVGDKLYLLGGKQRLAVQYSPASRQWVQLLSQPSARYGDWECCGVVHDGKLLLCGGSSEGNDRNMVEEYDLHTQQWQTADFTLSFPFCWVDSLVGSVHV